MAPLHPFLGFSRALARVPPRKVVSPSSSSSWSSPSRSLSSTARSRLPSFGFFQRPAAVSQPVANNTAVTNGKTRSPSVAMPHTPPHVPAEQSPNYPTTWSESQNPREMAMRGPRFEQMNMQFQPTPLSAMEMVQREPIRLSKKRVTSCDGGSGALGHPKVFINLDKPGPKACPYCGLRFELDHSHH